MQSKQIKPYLYVKEAKMIEYADIGSIRIVINKNNLFFKVVATTACVVFSLQTFGIYKLSFYLYLNLTCNQYLFIRTNKIGYFRVAFSYSICNTNGLSVIHVHLVYQLYIEQLDNHIKIEQYCIRPNQSIHILKYINSGLKVI